MCYCALEAQIRIMCRGLPCGIQPPEPVKDPDGDKLATIAARFSYFQEKRHTALTKTDLRRSSNQPARSKNSRPTVRLRPRQVLCSKCRSICNENNENVGRKRKLEEPSHSDQPTRRSDRRCSSTQQQQAKPSTHLNTRSHRLPQIGDHSDESSSSKTTSSSQSEQSHKFSPTLIPKISRLRPAEIGSAIQSKGSVKSCIQMAEQVRSAYWNGRDEENLAEAEAEVENRPMNTLSRPEPMELDSNPTQAYCATPRRLSSSSVESAKIPPDEEDKKTLAAADSTVKGGGRAVRVTRKKRSIGLMEDLWDESVFEDPARTTVTATRATPVIKISFGAQGEGTVLKIPSKIQHPYDGRDVDTDTEEAQTEPERDPLELPKSYEADAYGGYHHCGNGEDGQEQVDPQRQALLGKDCETASAKAAKKALKKAKKKALRKMYGATSPARSPCNGSPRYNSNFDKMMYHRRKHKVKHKKKHKEERKHKSQQSYESSNGLDHPNHLPVYQPIIADNSESSQHDAHQQQDSSAYTAIKEQCLKQKLSISLKRLNTNAYAARCEPSIGYPVSNASSGCKSPGATSDEEEDEEEEDTGCNVGDSGTEVAGETAPDFPPPQHPLVMRLSAAATPVEHCLTASGKRMDVGDVVWGKVHGFPWWPGKVLSITDAGKEDGTASGPQAHVAWYGSSTSSLMSCDQLSPFLETFKTRYNKKKKGPYKEAIRQAQSEARSQLIAPTSSAGSVLNVCGSPREVNVLS
ncbi:PWWP domain-containing protein 2A isoform X2 [Nasonia vitripennis]|uniref:PWWP domain-containing protein n=1 Tax=Nasonia vitripennis TaxID=7425 RepID=A0A7M7TAL9_NASVI|nr:PWWP domain-containing protein 2A isoform X2 [Nasonia vitripennis]